MADLDSVIATLEELDADVDVITFEVSVPLDQLQSSTPDAAATTDDRQLRPEGHIADVSDAVATSDEDEAEDVEETAGETDEESPVGDETDEDVDDALQQLEADAPLDHTDPDDLERAYEAADSIKAASEYFTVGYHAFYGRVKEFGIHSPNPDHPNANGEDDDGTDETATDDNSDGQPEDEEPEDDEPAVDEPASTVAADGQGEPAFAEHDVDPNDLVDALAGAASPLDVAKELNIANRDAVSAILRDLDLDEELASTGTLDRSTAEQAVREVAD